MTRTQKDATGKDVPTNTAAFGCHTVEHAKPASKTEPKPTAPAKASTKTPATEEPAAGNEGDN